MRSKRAVSRSWLLAITTRTRFLISPFCGALLNGQRTAGSSLSRCMRACSSTQPSAAASPWQAVLQAVSITGLINGADLRKTAVWDNVDVPWCLLFARNVSAPSGHRFFYLTPSYEPSLNQDGRFHIDYEAAQPVPAERVAREPWLLKILSLGTWRDVELIERLKTAFPQTLKEVWAAWDAKGLRTAEGYNQSHRPQKQAAFLGPLKDFRPHPMGRFEIDYHALITYEERYGNSLAHRPRTETLYQPPLVIIPQAPGEGSGRPKAFLSTRPLAFSKSFYGYSCAEHPDAGTLAALLYLLLHSQLFAYFCLMISARLGADRQTFHKEELDSIPFPDVTNLDVEMKATLQQLARRLEQDDDKPWDALDSCLFRLYGLDEGDLQTVRDTRFSAAVYRKQGRSALAPTASADRAAFMTELSHHIEPFFDICGEHAAVAEPSGWELDEPQEPWAFLTISRAGTTVPVNPALIRKAMQEANRRGASRILIRAPGRRGALLGVLNQRRFWTRTRALICAQHLIRQALDAFGLPSAEA